MFWITDKRKEADAMAAVAKFEVPPPGYTGSLAGTSWDTDSMLEGYEQSGQGVG